MRENHWIDSYLLAKPKSLSYTLEELEYLGYISHDGPLISPRMTKHETIDFQTLDMLRNPKFNRRYIVFRSNLLKFQVDLLDIFFSFKSSKYDLVPYDPERKPKRKPKKILNQKTVLGPEFQNSVDKLNPYLSEVSNKIKKLSEYLREDGLENYTFKYPKIEPIVLLYLITN